MDLDRDILDMIDDYVADALGATGTRKPRPVPVVAAAAPVEAAEIEIDVSDMGDDKTDPEGQNIFSFDEGTAWLATPFVAPREAIPTLSRIRTARGSQPPPAETEIDEDEITNVLGIPTSK